MLETSVRPFVFYEIGQKRVGEKQSKIKRGKKM